MEEASQSSVFSSEEPDVSDSKRIAELHALFSELDKTGSGYLDAERLQTAWVPVKVPEIEPDTMRMLIGMFGDQVEATSLNLEQFIEADNFISDITKRFSENDDDSDGRIDFDGFQQAVSSIRMTPGPTTLHTLHNTYRNADGSVSCERWFQMVVTTEFASMLFKTFDKSRRGLIDQEQFIAILCWFL
eukprot:gnl/Chilomastix_cuspidata/2347.p1 GENE.gnl/Chilomastix_cuspidata/2347~~gnl/Chilomastix_cuspidata/2347.p1  ORF type:complete len:188 (-),score=38.92 gnl/Chilomastix_cuspidata/2347:95-658(-)